MLEIKLNTIRLRIGFSFFAVMSLFFFFDNTKTGITALYALICHELGHLIVISAFGANVHAVTFYGAGIRISASTQQLTPAKRAAVLSAGCTVNLLLCLISLVCNAKLFAATNAVMCIFNLLPFGELDGAQLLKLMLFEKAPRGPSESILAVIQCIAALLLTTAIVLLQGRIDITFFITFLYLLLLLIRKI